MDNYTLEEISVAFGKTFHKSGEAFFDYLGTQEECEVSTTWYWKEFVENLKTIQEPTAYTVGNPKAYEPYMDDEPSPMKAEGGVVFLTREKAEEAVKSGFLPLEWFDGKQFPGKVYGLVGDPQLDFEEAECGLALTRPAKLVRV